MACYTHPDVEEARESPEKGALMKVILVIEDGEIEAVRERVDSLNVNIKREFDSGMLLIETPETELSEICDLPSVESVSPDGDTHTLA